MAGFCTNCGAPLNGAFCAGCGTRAQAAGASIQSQPVPPQAAVQPGAVAPKSSGLGKVLLIVGGILLVLFIIGTASAIYVAYWVRHKVSTYTSAVTGNGEVTVVGSGNSCRLLSTSELGNVLGVTIEKSSEVFEGSEPGCAYYTNTEGFAQLQRAAAELARQQAQQANGQQSGKIDNPLEILKNTNQLEGLVKSFGLSQPDKDGKVFSFTVNRHFGRRNWSPLRTTLSVVPGFEDLPDLGDRAMLGSMGHSIFVLKGDTMVSLELTYVPDARRRGAQLGNSIVARL